MRRDYDPIEDEHRCGWCDRRVSMQGDCNECIQKQEHEEYRRTAAAVSAAADRILEAERLAIKQITYNADVLLVARWAKDRLGEEY